MNVVLHLKDRLLLSVTADELIGISIAMNEICNGIQVDDAEFHSRLSVTREFLESVLRAFVNCGDNSTLSSTNSRVAAWSDEASIQAICIAASGDPVDMSVEEAKVFVKQLTQAIQEAEA